MHAVDIATDLVEAFNAGDLDRMRELLAPELVAWVTNADGEADRITGRDEYLSRIAAMDLPGGAVPRHAHAVPRSHRRASDPAHGRGSRGAGR